MPSVRKPAKPPCGKEGFSTDVPASGSASPDMTTLDLHLQVFSEPTPGLEPGTPSLRVKRVEQADSAISLQMRESCETAESVEVRGSPQRSSDVFQRCSNGSRGVCGRHRPFWPFTPRVVAQARTATS
jgi:hypothetical protein